MLAQTPYLDKQFVFVQGETRPEWLRDLAFAGASSIGDLYVGHNMPVAWVGDRDSPVGLWLGWPIALEPLAPPLAGESCDVEEYVYAHRGSFIYIDFTCDEPWIYLDACGSLGLVYDHFHGRVASTAWVAIGPADYRRRFRPEQLETYNVAAHGWIPGGESAHEGVERIMANHRLAPLSARIERHWAYGELDPGIADNDHLDAIGEECEVVLRHVLAQDGALMTLTAGNEARLLMACLADSITALPFFTIVDDRTSVDSEISERLAARFGLDWHPHAAQIAGKNQQERWQLTVGHNLSGSNMWLHPTVDAIGDCIMIGGLGGEIGRAFLWRNHMRNKHSPNPADLAKRLKLPLTTEIETNFESWLAGLPPGIDPIMTYELAYIELRMSCWAFAQSYTNPQAVSIAPLISRTAFTHMLSLSHNIRRSQSLASRIVQRRDPELLSIPINRFGNLRDYSRLITKVWRYVKTRGFGGRSVK